MFPIAPTIRAKAGRWMLACVLFGASASVQAQNMSRYFNSANFLGWMLYAPASCSAIVAVMLLMFPEGRSLLWKIVLGWVLLTALCFAMVMSASADPNGSGLIAFIAIAFSPWLGFLGLATGLGVASRRSKRKP